MPIAALLGTAAGAFTLDDVQLALCRILALTIREFAGQRRRIEDTLAHHFARLPRRFTRFGSQQRLLHDLACSLRVLFQVAAQVLTHHRFYDAFDLARYEL